MLMPLLILSLSGCQKVVYQTKEVAVLPDQGMLIHPCKKTLGFTTVRELAVNNRKNLGCIEKYQVVVDELITWKEEQLKIYNPQTNKEK